MFMLYHAAFTEERSRLREMAQSQARLIEAVGENDRIYNTNYPGGPVEATLAQLKEAHQKYQGSGDTGEFLVARQEKGKVFYLLRHRHTGTDLLNPIPFESQHVKPMKRALSGESGTMIAVDYRDEKVLAAYEPVAGLNWGIVSKIDLAEVRAPFLRAGAVAAGLSLVVVSLGAALFWRISEPIKKTLEQRALDLESLNSKLKLEITDRKKAEEQVHDLSQALMVAHETEKQLIALELHDRLAQDLATLKLGLHSLVEDHTAITKPEEVEVKAHQLLQILEESIGSIRDISYNLRPPALDKVGLVEAVSEYCHNLEENSGISVDFYSGGMEDLDLPSEIEINLYRLVQEGLTNTVKHANATEASIRLTSAYPNVLLRIQDNGSGFDVQGSPKNDTGLKKSVGITGMYERVRLLGGTMKIESVLNKGTRISIKIPYPGKAEHESENDSDS